MIKTLKKNIFITILSVLLIYFLYKVRGILWPFILGGLIAYLLEGITSKLANKIKNRRIASMFMIGLFTIIVVLLLTFIVPIILTQAVELIKELAIYLNANSEKMSEKMTHILEFLGMDSHVDFKTYIASYSKNITGFFLGVINNLLSKSMAFISVISLLIITPITAYHFLNAWNNIIETIKNYIPNKNKEKIYKLFKKMDEVLIACIREQLVVCLILGLFYGTLLMFSGLKFGFLIGLLTGLASFIPYVGMFLGFFTALLTNFYQFGLDTTHLLIVIGIFICGQILEANFLTPNLVGSKIQLHPLWVIFALFTGGTLFGFVGLLVALPIAAITGVLVRFYIKEKIKIKQ